jgi:hypothetical protein
MIFTTGNWDDINRYYKSTYVKFTEMGDKLFYIRHVNPTSVTGCDEDGTEFELYLDDEHPYEVDYVLPNKSFFQHHKRAVLLQRVPAKQYQRGISVNNVRLTSLAKTGGLSTLDIGFEILKSFVTKQTYLSLETAVKNTGRYVPVALSPRMAYVPDASYIYVDTTPVASLDKKTKSITMLAPIFRNEVTALTINSPYKVA